MASITHAVTTVTRHSYSVPAESGIRAIEDAVAMAKSEYHRATGKLAVSDDWLRVQPRDGAVEFYFEHHQTKDAP